MDDGKPDMDLVRDVLRSATAGPSAEWSQRGLSAKAGEGRDVVGDIINGRNKNPTIKVLMALAQAMGKDFSIFGMSVGEKPAMPSEAALTAMFEGLLRPFDLHAGELPQTLAKKLPTALRQAEGSPGPQRSDEETTSDAKSRPRATRRPPLPTEQRK